MNSLRQNEAHQKYADGVLDLDAVQMGWGIGPGTELRDPTIGATITLQSEISLGLYEVHLFCPTKNLDRTAQLSLRQIATGILSGKFTVQ